MKFEYYYVQKMNNNLFDLSDDSDSDGMISWDSGSANDFVSKYTGYCHVSGDATIHKNCESIACARRLTGIIIGRYAEETCKNLLFTYFAHSYVDFKQLPTSINKYILLFINYGDELSLFVHNYLKYFYPYFNDDDLIKKIYSLNTFHQAEVARGFLRTYSYNNHYYAYVSPIIKCIKIIIDTFADPDMYDVSKYLHIKDNFNDTFVSMLYVILNSIKCNYDVKFENILYDAIRKSDYNLIRVLASNSSQIKGSTLNNIVVSLDDWKIITLLHINHNFCSLGFLHALSRTKKESLIKYIIDNIPIKSSMIYSLVEFACTYGNLEVFKHVIEKDTIYFTINYAAIALNNENYHIFKYMWYNDMIDRNCIFEALNKYWNFPGKNQALFLHQLMTDAFDYEFRKRYLLSLTPVYESFEDFIEYDTYLYDKYDNLIN